VTLVLTLITREFVCQVSDRRLTDSSTGKRIDRPASKTVIWARAHVMISYTGLADIGTDETDVWLAKTVPKLEGSIDFPSALADVASTVFRGPPICRLDEVSKRHTFIVAGWTADDSDGDYDPIYCSISNCEDDQGRMLDRARDDFHSRTHRLVAFERYATYEAGQPLRDTERLQMERAVSSALRSPGGKERAASIVLLRS
jgi:hypothetical protein